MRGEQEPNLTRRSQFHEETKYSPPSLQSMEKNSNPASDDATTIDSSRRLVHAEERIIRGFRLLLVAFLIGATLSTAAVIYSLARADAVADHASGIADKLVTTFLEESERKVWTARGLSTSVSGHFAVDPVGGHRKNNPWDLYVPEWEFLTEGSVLKGRADAVVWAPFLFDDVQRTAFEEAAVALEEVAGLRTQGSEPPCFVCENPEDVIHDPDREVELGGVGTLTCGRLYGAGLSGSVSRCAWVQDHFRATCECAPPTDDQVDPIVRRSAIEGLWRVATADDNVFARAGDAVPVALGADGAVQPHAPMANLKLRGGSQATFYYDQMSDPIRRPTLQAILKHGVPTFSPTFVREGPYYEQFVRAEIGEDALLLGYPVFDPNPGNRSQVLGSIMIELLWSSFFPFNTIFPAYSGLFDIVVSNTCGQSYTFRLDEETNGLILQGKGDLHNHRWDSLSHSTTADDFAEMLKFATGNDPIREEELNSSCLYSFSAYGTDDFDRHYGSGGAILYSSIICGLFFFVSCVFLIYDIFIRRRQRRLVDRAIRNSTIVASLFPDSVRERLLAGTATSFQNNREYLRSFWDSDDANAIFESEPIADNFPNTTVCFIDIVGFTAWSSERNPTQVFRLLESLYLSFDRIAQTEGIFKVETIGDCYVAVVGLPNPREDHAVAMVRFVQKCLGMLDGLLEGLVPELGLDTRNLGARVGLHSGPVTAGVLRGTKARFQLFGDSVNVAARMESSGSKNRIHVSQATQDELVMAGKGDWLQTREDMITPKGKAKMQTYWVNCAPMVEP